MRPLSLLLVIAVLAAPAAGQVVFPDEQFAFDVANPAVGSWVGNATIPQAPDQQFFGALVVEQREGGDPSVRLTMIPIGALHLECTVVEHGGRTLEFKLTPPGGELRFRGEVSEDGQRYTGDVTRFEAGVQKNEPTAFEFARTTRPTDLDNHMAFTGELNVQTVKLGMSIVLARTPGGNWVGHLDVPMQMLRAYPLINFSRQDGMLTAELPIPGGASIEMELAARDQRLTGVFRQPGLEMPFDFARDLNYAYKEITRPQEPKPPYPYEEREIAVEHPDGFTIAGTLTVPNADDFGDGPFPVAVLISGSGQQDRDESLLGHKPFLVLADHLTRHGIAVMRYDDRGIGGSGGLSTVETATSQDFATDALAVVNHLKSLDVIDSDRIGLIGHSEGGLIAPLVGGMTDDIDFMVLMAGPGVPGREVLDVQRKKLSMAAGMSESDADEQNRDINLLIDAALEGADLDALVGMAMNMNKEDPDPMTAGMSEDELRAAMRTQIGQIVNPWMQFFLRFDPTDALRAVRCPVLAINGTLDLQVWHEQNLDAIERILTDSGVNVKAIRYKGLNHLFQKAETGTVGEYAEIETTIEPMVLEDITNWILEKTGQQESDQ